MDEISIPTLRSFLRDNFYEKIDEIDNVEIWIKDDSTIIQIPKSGFIDFEIFEEIAIEQVRINPWDWDYWLGQNGIS